MLHGLSQYAKLHLFHHPNNKSISTFIYCSYSTSNFNKIFSSNLHYFDHKIKPTQTEPYRTRSCRLYEYHVSNQRCVGSSILDYFDNLLQQCTKHGVLKQIHSQILSTSLCDSGFLAARLVTLYSKFGFLDYAKRVFESTPNDGLKSVLLWNSILRACVSREEYDEVIEIYRKMQSFDVLPDGFSFPLVLRACANLGDVNVSEIVHCHVVQMGFQYNVHVGNELLAVYGKVGLVEVARCVFDKMVVRNIISWNSMVSGYAFCGDCHGAFEIFMGMKSKGLEPNSVTWTSLLSSFARCGRRDKLWDLYHNMRRKGFGDSAELLAVVISVCADRNSFCKGKMVHDSVVKGGFENYTIVRNSLICMYGKNGALDEAEYLFSELEAKSIVSWNVLISSYAESGFCDESYEKFLQLENLNVSPVVRPNVVSWSAVIGGFASKGRYEEALELFRRMQLAKVTANSVAVSSVMMACAELSALRLGKEIHAHALRNLADCDMLLINGLISMYMKCGSLKEGKSIFYRTERKDLITWNTMIAGFGFHGLGNDALSMFHEMISEGYKPDECTFISVLSACSHAGLVTQGRQYFDRMKREFSIEPQIEHYACMVDLLGRSGLLNEASEIIKSMPMEPNAYVFGALLNSCKMYKNTDIAEDTAAHIYSLGSETSGSIMLLSNLYAASGRWADAAKARLSAKEKGIKKLPGQSWIEVKKKVHMFSAGNSANTGMEDIRRMIDNLGLQMGIMGYTQREKFMSDTDNQKVSIHNMYEECMLCELS